MLFRSEMADLVADNRIAELSEIDADIMRDVLKNMGGTELAITGYDEQEVARFTKEYNEETARTTKSVSGEVDGVEEGSVGSTDEQKEAVTKTKMQCPKCKHRFKL